MASKAYVQQLKERDEIDKVSSAIVMDMVAYNKNGIVDLETNRAHKSEAEWYAKQALTYTCLKPNITMPAWGSDHVPFLKAGVPALLTIEHWDTRTPHYHRRSDKPATLNYDYAVQVVRMNVAALIQKAGVRLDG